MVEPGIGRQREGAGRRADTNLFPFQIIGTLDSRPHVQKIVQLLFHSEEHDHIATCANRIGDMGRAEQSELNISGEHRLHRPAGDDVYELRLEVVFSENVLFLGDPQRHSVAADRAIGEKKFRRRLSAMSHAQPKPNAN
jgi:hypothetical protein